MDRKKELIIIGVAMLLVLAVGITMAFFSQNVDVKGEANQSVDVQTITIEDTILKVEGKLQFNDLDIYPGHKNISSIKVTATGDKELLYNLTWTGINTLNTPLKYTVYKTLSEVSPSITCSKKSLQLHYFETCEETNFDKLGTPIATGNISTATTETKFKLAYNESVQATSDGVVYYYYVVLEFPNLDTDQNLDMGGEFDGITSAEVLDERDNTAPINMDDIINNSNAKTETPDFSVIATTDEGVYRVSDGMYGGNSYYWRGAATTNYIKFAGKCWRIIRINGDKTMRLIYDGATCHANGTSTADSIAVASTAYNSSYNRSEYVGWKYTSGSQRPSSITSGTNAPIKTTLENWYNTNIGNNTTYSSKIADGKYCNDRNVQSGQSWASAPSSSFNYAGYNRINTGAPTLSCAALDTYTLKVGLITSDEVMYAGGKFANNTSYYLYNGQNYWTMSPACWSGSAWVFIAQSSGYLDYSLVNNTTRGVRPVINLKADAQISGGNGTKDNPYIVA